MAKIAQKRTVRKPHARPSKLFGIMAQPFFFFPTLFLWDERLCGASWSILVTHCAFQIVLNFLKFFLNVFLLYPYSFLFLLFCFPHTLAFHYPMNLRNSKWRICWGLTLHFTLNISFINSTLIDPFGSDVSRIMIFKPWICHFILVLKTDT